MTLNENYKKCACGKSLNKRNRFGVKFESPENINNQKRENEGKKTYFKTTVIYCCEKCFEKHHNLVHCMIDVPQFIYYHDSHPV